MKLLAEPVDEYDLFIRLQGKHTGFGSPIEERESFCRDERKLQVHEKAFSALRSSRH
jgi:hypothetical protein